MARHSRAPGKADGPAHFVGEVELDYHAMRSSQVQVISPYLDRMGAFSWLKANATHVSQMLKMARAARVFDRDAKPWWTRRTPERIEIVARVEALAEYVFHDNSLEAARRCITESPCDTRRMEGLEAETSVRTLLRPLAKTDEGIIIATLTGKKPVSGEIRSTTLFGPTSLVTRLPMKCKFAEGEAIMMLVGSPDEIGFGSSGEYIVREWKCPANPRRNPYASERIQAKTYALAFVAARPGLDPAEWGYPETPDIEFTLVFASKTGVQLAVMPKRDPLAWFDRDKTDYYHFALACLIADGLVEHKGREQISSGASQLMDE